ncbi:hypothetical protein [Algicella marina]|uniref:Nudix hydrolase domain-containing protein n=1 Tax=Algicella marina TaxID=2683284 RepID=A0A6P1T129_9RHOB|nr:hypothetical protein [Algicella marina]QHQ35441.1 hypothetical protein GO499_09675 [Algicella marina]
MAETGKTNPLGEPTFWDNAQHVLKTFFSLKTFSEGKFANKLYTRWSVMRFVAKHWRRRFFLITVVSAALAMASALYRVFSEDASIWTLYVAVGSLLVAIGTLIYKLLFLHKPRAFGGEFSDLKIRKTRLTDPKSPYAKGGELHFNKIVSLDPDVPIIRVRQFNDLETANWVEFDQRVSRHLLDGHIKCRPTAKNEFFHFDTQDILNARKEVFRDDQIEVLDILSREAVTNGRSFFDAEKMSLGALDLKDGELTAELGRTTYFCSMVTNDAASKIIVHENNKIHSDSLLKMYPVIGIEGETPSKRTFRLQSITETHGLSNHIGSVVAAVSSDGIPVLCFQRMSANINAGRSVMSGSGSLEYMDFFHSGADKTGNLDDAIRFGMARELLEETGGIPQDSHRAYDRERLRRYAKNIQLAGYYRDLKRGAFPIFVGFCKMEASFAVIQDRRPSKIWFMPAPMETKIDVDLPLTEIKSVEQYREYLKKIYLNGEVDRSPSDQVLIIYELLGLDPVAHHFQRVLDR